MTMNRDIRLEAEYRSGILRKMLFIAALAAVCIAAAGISLTINGRGIGFLDCYEYILGHIAGATYERGTAAWFDDYVLWNTYLPRIVMAIVSGCGLAVSGVLMQGVLSNPLADPYTTGVSDGAALGASVAIITGLTFSSIAGSMGIVANAFVCSIIPAAILIVLSNVIRMTPATCILAGTALSGILSGIQSLIMYGADSDTLASALKWGIGTFNQTSWDDCMVPIVVTAAGIAASAFLHRGLNLLALGDAGARSLGLDADRFRTVCMIVATLVATSVICYVGVIGFVGLVAPHMVRMAIGGDNRLVIPASMLAGSALLLVSDLLARVLVYPDELRVGVIMSVIGAPVFLFMILGRKRRYGEGFRCPRHPPQAWSPNTAAIPPGRCASWPF